MEFDQHLAGLLHNTTLAAEGPRKQAELDLIHASKNPEYPAALLRIGANETVQAPVELRQSALTVLRKFIEKNWSPEGDDGPYIPIPDHVKDQLRVAALNLVLSPEDERKVKVAAR